MGLLQQNLVWIIPVLSILLTFAIRTSAKPDTVTLGYIDYLDFGYDLSIAAITLLLTEAKDIVGGFIIVVSFLVVILVTIINRRTGWQTELNQPALWSILLSDFVGIVLLVAAILYSRGEIK